MTTTSKRIGPRSVMERCKGRVDDEVLFCLTAIAEDLVEQRKEITMVVQTVDQLANISLQLTDINMTLKERLEAVRREDLDDVTSPYVTAVDPKEDN